MTEPSVRDTAFADRTNATFYGKYPYPWPARQLLRPHDPGFGVTALNLDLGGFLEPAVTTVDRIWVAGCGTNQAIELALRFPQSEVVGSDLSTTSLDHASSVRDALDIDNLDLREESINDVGYDAEFDYVVCTAVIQHNARPEETLRAVARAMKDDGVLEIAVNNLYVALGMMCIQDAVRLLLGADEDADLAERYQVAHPLLDWAATTEPSIVRAAFDEVQGHDTSHIADVLLQPIVWAYTIDQLAALCAACDLSLVLPRLHPYDSPRQHTVGLGDPSLRARYEGLSAVGRWKVVNALVANAGSPFLWFYVSKHAPPASHDKDVAAAFLESALVRYSTECTPYVWGSDHRYHARMPRRMLARELPGALRGHDADFDGHRPTGAVLAQHGYDVDSLDAVTAARLALASSAHPFLVPARVAGAGGADGST